MAKKSKQIKIETNDNFSKRYMLFKTFLILVEVLQLELIINLRLGLNLKDQLKIVGKVKQRKNFF